MSTSVSSTPTKDRPAPSSSRSNTQLPATSRPPPASVQALLNAHASAPDPAHAALEQALLEWSTLSNQNAQLWKLIDKQRTGYNQLLKELERLRSDRDSYRSRLHALDGTSDSRRQRTPKTSLSGSSSSELPYASSHSRAPLARHQSDDPPTTRNGSNPSLLSSPTQEPPLLSSHNGPSSKNSSNTLNSLHSDSFSISSAYLPNAASQSRPSLDLPPETAPPSHSPDATTHPVHQLTPRKPSAPPLVQSSTQARVVEERERSATAPVIVGSPLSTPASLTPGSETTTTTSAPPQPSLPNINPNIHPPSLHPNPLSPSQLLSPNGPLRPSENPRVISRESRVSIPDETKQYIANMVESPLPSPHVGDSFTSSPPQRTQKNTFIKVQLETNEESGGEFLDMIDDDEEEEEEERRERSEQEEATEDEEGESMLESVVEEEETIDHDAEHHSLETHETVRSRRQTTPNDFPLPPTTTTTTHASGPSTVATAPQAAASPSSAESSSLPTDPPLSGSHEPFSEIPEVSSTPMESVFASGVLGPQITKYSDPPSFASRSTLASDMQQQHIQHHTGTSNGSSSFRELPLLPKDLPSTRIRVSHSSIRPNDRGKEVVNFTIEINPGSGKDLWKVEKLFSDVLAFDARIRAVVGKSLAKRIASLPEGKLWRDHAPARVDQRKAALEQYLQSLIALPVKDKNEIIAFFTSDIIREANRPVMQAGCKEGYLTKRGKNFGGWKTRFFVLQGPVLEYYESRGGAHLGSITITGAQIGRQQSSSEKRGGVVDDEEKEYRHAFLIIEAKRNPVGHAPRHVLCAESDEDRDSWVEVLIRYVHGFYNEDPVALPPAAGSNNTAMSPPRDSSSSASDSQQQQRRPARGMSGEISHGAAVPIAQLTPDAGNQKLFQAPSAQDDAHLQTQNNNQADQQRSSSPSKEPSPIDGPVRQTFTDGHNGRRLLERRNEPINTTDLPASSSLPSGSPLDGLSPSGGGPRSTSELGNYPDLHSTAGGIVSGAPARQPSPEKHRGHDKRTGGGNEPSSSSGDHPGKVKISGPLNGTPIPSGFKFGGKESSTADVTSTPLNDKREKTKSRGFWGGWRVDKTAPQAVPFIPRAVFGVPLEESLDVAQIANLPAIVFRCIQYLEAKKADQEEGIYRLSGSSAVIKGLKDRFNAEGDIDLLMSDEYWDPHAIAGLLKSFLRELPASILTRDLHRFLAVIDLMDPDERISELTRLIAALPIANYSLLRALTAHLILIVQNANVNKMTMRNVGIVFSPTLGIPAGVFSLMLAEFNKVFKVDDVGDTDEEVDESEVDMSGDKTGPKRNSRQYSDAAADQMLGLSGRTLLKTPSEDAVSVSEDEDLSADDGNIDTTDYADSTHRSIDSAAGSLQSIPQIQPSSDEMTAQQQRRASHVAQSRGLNIAVSERGNRHSRIMGLPSSPRPGQPSTSPYGIAHPTSPPMDDLQTPR